jgi:8-oxo-dGTP pyrophosphatase MutT (NUDIX family)
MDVREIRTHVRDEVLARLPVDDREERSISAFVTHFDVLDAPFDEDADPVHVTASALVVGERGVVLHLHKRLEIWLQPGGHIDAGELPWDAAIRETFEETGLPAVHHPRWVGPDGRPILAHVDVHPGPRGHTHLDLRYVVLAPALDPRPDVDESPDVDWFSWDDAIAMADVGLRGALLAIRNVVEDPASGTDG